MLLDHEITSARSQGWLLTDVFDARTKRTRPEILPITFTPPFGSARAATGWVIQRAKNGDTLAQKALQIVMQGLK
jgi:hypothetical protein